MVAFVPINAYTKSPSKAEKQKWRQKKKRPALKTCNQRMVKLVSPNFENIQSQQHRFIFFINFRITYLFISPNAFENINN